MKNLLLYALFALSSLSGVAHASSAVTIEDGKATVTMRYLEIHNNGNVTAVRANLISNDLNVFSFDAASKTEVPVDAGASNAPKITKVGESFRLSIPKLEYKGNKAIEHFSIELSSTELDRFSIDLSSLKLLPPTPKNGGDGTITIAAPSLENNVIGESTQRNLYIYLPANYSSSSTPLPVIYYLPGFSVTGILDIISPAAFQQKVNGLNPSILVVVSGVNRFGGSFFTNSPVTGNWADFVAKDVVDYVDNNYRTIVHKSARGIAGHSMGGFGALDLAMKNPGIFGSVFSLAPGLVGADGIDSTQMFYYNYHIRDFLSSTASINSLSAQDALAVLSRNVNNFDIAYGMAFAPKSTPPYFEYPYTLSGGSLVRNDAIFVKWESGFGNVRAEVANFKSNLLALNGIGLDCATNDEYYWIVQGCDFYDAELSANGIPHSYTTHQGRHQGLLPSRILDVMLPFFSQRLARQ